MTARRPTDPLSQIWSQSLNYFILDENECEAGTHKCSPYAKCLNTIGSHKCSCRGGFTGDGYACYDIDECAKGQHNCNKPGSRCKNTPGRFECECAPGYTGNYASGCYDKNECTDGTAVCADDAVCYGFQIFSWSDNYL